MLTGKSKDPVIRGTVNQGFTVFGYILGDFPITCLFAPKPRHKIFLPQSLKEALLRQEIDKIWKYEKKVMSYQTNF